MIIVASCSKAALRRAEPGDRARAYAWLAQSDLTARSFGAPLYFDRPAPSLGSFGETYLPHYFDGTRPFDGRLFMIRAGDAEVGCIAHHEVNLSRDVVELDLWLAEQRFCGRGYGSEAIDLLCAWLQDSLGVNRFMLRTSRRNVRALRAMRRAGFRETDLPNADVIEKLSLNRGHYNDELLLFRFLPLPRAELTVESNRVYVFVDSEFTNLYDPRLISVGAVATDSTSFYCELNDWPREHCSEFVERTVLPLLDGDAVPHPMAADAFSAWIEEKINRAPTTIVSDSGFDRWALSDLLGREDLPAGTEWLRVPIAYESLDEVALSLGLRRHHALDDARALRHAVLHPSQ
jgi:RimJ/RimL family protein N-acetyltransferase